MSASADEKTQRIMPVKLIIQIPCFNEEASLPYTIADLPKHIDGIDKIEYLIIDDGSSDKTAAIARELGVRYIVRFSKNRGLARGFMAGLDACLRLGADIIVNTDADNQYSGRDIALLVKPILEGSSDIVIGARPINEISHFSKQKKLLQRFGSFVVRLISGANNVDDAPSGFRAYSREAAMSMNVVNEYTYTLETIIQAGHNRLAISSVPIHTNPELRESRLFKSIWSYIRRSVIVMVRAYMMYKPLKFFTIMSLASIFVGAAIVLRFLILYFTGGGGGHLQSLILAAVLILVGVQCGIAGLQADLIASNRKILEDIQYHARRNDYERYAKESNKKKGC
jgi:glycosyltransferase involved in cell wall biosynthesis